MTSRNRGKNVSRKNNEVKQMRKNLKSSIKLMLINLFCILILVMPILYLCIFTNINENVRFSVILTILSIVFTLSTELKDWNDYFLRNKNILEANILQQSIYYLPVFTIVLLFFCLFTYIFNYISIISDNIANILTVSTIILYALSYTYRSILIEKYNTEMKIKSL